MTGDVEGVLHPPPTEVAGEHRPGSGGEREQPRGAVAPRALARRDELEQIAAVAQEARLFRHPAIEQPAADVVAIERAPEPDVDVVRETVIVVRIESREDV